MFGDLVVLFVLGFGVLGVWDFGGLRLKAQDLWIRVWNLPL